MLMEVWEICLWESLGFPETEFQASFQIFRLAKLSQVYWRKVNQDVSYEQK